MDFESHRNRLFRLAYRMLGNVSDSEDILQEAYIRWERQSHSVIEQPSLYLNTVVTRLCIESLRSAKAKRELYVGQWLPEPLVEGLWIEPLVFLQNPEELHEKSDSLSIAFLFLLEKFSPVERAIFLLREIFDYSFEEIAAIVDKKKDNCRQIFKRSKEKIPKEPTNFSPQNKEKEQELFMQFALACSTGEMEALVALLSEEVVLYSDGGGKVPSARNAIVGSNHVARFFLGLISKMPAHQETRFVTINGQMGVMVVDGNVPKSLVTFGWDGKKIDRLFAINNPDKLQNIRIQNIQE